MSNFFWEQKQTDNPFRNKEGLLSLYRLSPQISLALADCKTNADIELFWTLVFRIGDVRRLHNILKKNGINILGDGAAQRYEFHDVLSAIKHAGHYEDLVKLMGLIHEYTNFENLLYPHLKTDRKTGALLNHRKPLFKIPDIINYLKTNWNNWSFTEKQLILKFMPAIPRKRDKKKAHTNQRNDWNYKLIQAFIAEPTFGVKTGKEYTKLRSEYNKNSVGTRIAVGKNHPASFARMSRAEFFKWIEVVPAEARRKLFAITSKNENHVLNDGSTVISAYKEWDQKKKNVNDELRKLQAKKTMATRGLTSTSVQSTSMSVNSLSADPVWTVEDQIKELELTEQAKVTYGANSLIKVWADYKADKIGRNEASNMFDNILQTMHSDVIALPVIDVSGSMHNNAAFRHSGKLLDSLEVAAIYATAFMLKSTSELFFTFHTTVQAMYPGVNLQTSNFYFRNTTNAIIDSIINLEDDFITNAERVLGICRNQSGGATDFSALTEFIVEYCNTTGINLAEQFPAIVVFSDGHFNGRGVPDAVAQRALGHLRSLGWNGILIVWDIASSIGSSNSFKNIQNVVGLHTNDPSTIDDFIRGTFSMNYVDGFAPLKRLHESERYRLVREALAPVKQSETIHA